MIYKLAKSIHDNEAETLFCKVAGLNNPETNVLTHNRFYDDLVSFFSQLNKNQIYKIQYRDSPHHEIEIFESFNYLNLFEPNEHTEDYHIKKPDDKKFLFEIEDEKIVYVAENIVTFEKNDKTVKYYSNLGFNDIKFPYA